MQEQQKDTENLDSFMCPSFNYYFTDQDMNKIQNDAAFSASLNNDTDFAFAAFRDEPSFFDDAVFPLFESEVPSDGRDSRAAVLRFPITGDEHERSDSSSEADELEGVPSGTYCVWTPNSPQASPEKCKKSNSTGSSSSSESKKWKLLDLLRRSNSEGKQWFLFLTAAPEKKKVNERWSIEVAGKSKEKGLGGEKKVAISAHEALYVRNREMRMIHKRKSFLPYKPHLLGFSASRLAKPFLPK